MLAEKANILYRYNADHEMEPYSIIKRSMDNPIFHPYFIDYGYNKEELLNRMILWIQQGRAIESNDFSTYLIVIDHPL